MPLASEACVGERMPCAPKLLKVSLGGTPQCDLHDGKVGGFCAAHDVVDPAATCSRVLLVGIRRRGYVHLAPSTMCAEKEPNFILWHVLTQQREKVYNQSP